MRHYPRAALRTQKKDAIVAAAMLVGGHYSWNSATGPRSNMQFMSALGEFGFLIPPNQPYGASIPTGLGNWSKATLGTMQDLSTLESAVEQIHQWMVRRQ